MRWLVASLALLFVVPPVSVAAQDITEYYGLDAVGSVRIVFDSAGNVVTTMDYGPFGEQLSPSAFGRRHYAELFRDGETGQDYAEARMYQWRTGRFGAPDSIYSSLFDPQAWNRYSYVLNRPTALVDSTGLEAEQSQGQQMTCSFDKKLNTDVCRASGETVNVTASLPSEWWWLAAPINGEVIQPDWIGVPTVLSVIGGTAAGTAVGTVVAVETQAKLDDLGNLKFGEHDPKIKKKKFQWQRTFHMDYDSRWYYGYHFNADIGPLKRFNHQSVPHWLHFMAGPRTFRTAAGAAGGAAVVLDVYQLSTAENKCVAAAGVAGGFVGGAAGAWLGSAVPGPGTIAGGAAGGGFGAWAGEKLGGLVCR